MVLYKNFIYKQLLLLPAPLNISYLWNYGSLLGSVLMMQILTGLLVSLHYCNNMNIAFDSINRLVMDINLGWIFRSLHANGASLFFLFLYIHIGRGLYYSSMKYYHTWGIGVIIVFLLMATGFLGYVLPWGQMSYWGATVIINLISTVPFLGKSLVQLIWGDYSVSGITLNRLYSIHFLLPFILLFMMILHIFFLHEKGSSNPLSFMSKNMKMKFHNMHFIKDIYLIMFFMIIFFSFSFLYPNDLIDSENFMKANILVTPDHIKPEWYYLFAYAILRAIPNKLGGVLALVLSILVLSFLCVKNNMNKNKRFYYKKNNYWFFIFIFFILTWLGGQLVESPYIIMGQIMSIMYFLYISFIYFISLFIKPPICQIEKNMIMIYLK